MTPEPCIGIPANIGWTLYCIWNFVWGAVILAILLGKHEEAAEGAERITGIPLGMPKGAVILAALAFILVCNFMQFGSPRVTDISTCSEIITPLGE